jgi:hypothetical protein
MLATNVLAVLEYAVVVILEITLLAIMLPSVHKSVTYTSFAHWPLFLLSSFRISYLSCVHFHFCLLVHISFICSPKFNFVIQFSPSHTVVFCLGSSCKLKIQMKL